jgi:hypothetical protein
MVKLNCWEFKKCGREPGGSKTQQFGICPASQEMRIDGANNGKRGGRCCWAVTGTLCGGAVQGTYAAKLGNCMQCDFYKQVKTEEGPSLKSSKEILDRLK